MSYSIGRSALKTFDIERAVYGKFDGSTNYVSVPDNANLNFGTGDFSVEWFGYLTPNGSFQDLVDKHDAGSPNKGFFLCINSDNKIRFDVLIENGANIVSATTPIIVSGLYHIVACKIGNSEIIYLNGVAQPLTYLYQNYDGSSIDIALPMYICQHPSGVWKGNAKTYLTRLHNRALSASEVLSYYNSGRPDLYVIPYSDRWGSQTNLVTNGTFDTDLTGWTNHATYVWDTAEWTSNGVHLVSNGVQETSAYQSFYQLLGTNLIQGKTYRISYNIKSITGQVQVAVMSAPVGSNRGYSLNINSAGIVTTQFVATSSGATYFEMYQASNTSCDVVIDDISLTEVGVIADYRFNEGGGYQVKDYSANKLHGTLNGTYDGFWQNNKQFFTKEFTFLHSAISSSSATTTLFKLPPNVKIKERIADPTVAFDTDNTISIGISGNDTLFDTITGTNSTTPQYANLNKDYSPNNEVQVYIKKAGASTTGSITLKFRFENLNYKGSIPSPSIL